MPSEFKKDLSPDAQSIQDAFDDYAYRVSHDLQASCRIISHFSEKLLQMERSSDEKSEQYFEHLMRASDKLQQMIDALLTYSQLGSSIAENVSANTRKIVYQLVKNLDVEKSLNAKIEVPTLPPMRGSVKQIEMLWMHLLQNAVKFQPVGVQPKISVMVFEHESEYVFGIEDNGIGVSDAFQAKMFSMFEVYDSRAYPGLGVGLALCKKIVGLHGGRIWVESSLGKGTTIFFSWPQ